MDDRSCHLYKYEKGNREHYMFVCEKSEKESANTFGRFAPRCFQDMIKIENYMELFRKFVRDTKLGMFGFIDDESD